MSARKPPKGGRGKRTGSPEPSEKIVGFTGSARERGGDGASKPVASAVLRSPLPPDGVGPLAVWPEIARATPALARRRDGVVALGVAGASSPFSSAVRRSERAGLPRSSVAPEESSGMIKSTTRNRGSPRR